MHKGYICAGSRIDNATENDTSPQFTTASIHFPPFSFRISIQAFGERTKDSKYKLISVEMISPHACPRRTTNAQNKESYLSGWCENILYWLLTIEKRYFKLTMYRKGAKTNMGEITPFQPLLKYTILDVNSLFTSFLMNTTSWYLSRDYASDSIYVFRTDKKYPRWITLSITAMFARRAGHTNRIIYSQFQRCQVRVAI